MRRLCLRPPAPACAHPPPPSIPARRRASHRPGQLVRRGSGGRRQRDTVGCAGHGGGSRLGALQPQAGRQGAAGAAGPGLPGCLCMWVQGWLLRGSERSVVWHAPPFLAAASAPSWSAPALLRARVAAAGAARHRTFCALIASRAFFVHKAGCFPAQLPAHAPQGPAAVPARPAVGMFVSGHLGDRVDLRYFLTGGWCPGTRLAPVLQAPAPACPDPHALVRASTVRLSWHQGCLALLSWKAYALVAAGAQAACWAAAPAWHCLEPPTFGRSTP